MSYTGRSTNGKRSRRGGKRKREATGRSGRIALVASVASVLTPLVARAANLYWDGTNTGWNLTASWSTASNATTPDPLFVPGSSDTAIFNITTVNTGQGCNLNANQTASGIIFNSTGSVLIQSGGGSNTLTLGTGGITINPGAGADTITAPVVNKR